MQILDVFAKDSGERNYDKLPDYIQLELLNMEMSYPERTHQVRVPGDSLDEFIGTLDVFEVFYRVNDVLCGGVHVTICYYGPYYDIPCMFCQLGRVVERLWCKYDPGKDDVLANY